MRRWRNLRAGEGTMKSFIGLPAAPACLSRRALPRLTFPRSANGLTRQIADDAGDFNEAYGQAVSAQILLNILRSRDRLPRYYLAMTGISDSPSWRYHPERRRRLAFRLATRSPRPGASAMLGIQRERTSRPSYAVQPFSADNADAHRLPTDAQLMCSSIIGTAAGRAISVADDGGVDRKDRRRRPSSTSYTNEANTIFDDCVASVAYRRLRVRARNARLSASAPAAAAKRARH